MTPAPLFSLSEAEATMQPGRTQGRRGLPPLAKTLRKRSQVAIRFLTAWRMRTGCEDCACTDRHRSAAMCEPQLHRTDQYGSSFRQGWLN